MSDDRVTYNGDVLDEIVVSEATVHLEAMGWHWYCLIISRGGKEIMLNVRDANIGWDFLGIPYRIGADLLMCPETWKSDDYQGMHRCDRHKPGHRKHRCECGSRP